MRVVVDGVFFQRYLTGIARVWWSVLSEWKSMGVAGEVVVLDRDHTLPAIGGYEKVVIPRHDYAHLETDRMLLQRVCDQVGADVFVSTYFSFPERTASVVMVHDMTPEVTGTISPGPMWDEKREAIKRATRWVCVSNHTRADLLRLYPQIPSANVKVAHCGVWPVFAQAPAEKIAALKERMGVDRPYYLTVGPHAVEKNTRVIFQGFMQFAQREEHLLVSAGARPNVHPVLAEAIDQRLLKLPGRLSDEDLATAYSGAEALLYPSIYEGFGLPLLEAMACGCPVITSRVASLPEVAGEAGIYVDPRNPAEVAEAMVRVKELTVRERCVRMGLERAKGFSWRKMAEEVWKVVGEAAG
ncbi:MAG TPA: glycosyltransferase family 1 protein [Tepidisphaeraceae bacterium]|jgi:glycosyltransferase involved in cell wall biosynthesis